MKEKRKRNKILLGVSLLLAIILVLSGGIKIMIYLLLLLTGIFVGIKYTNLRRLYDDYKLSLRVNSILVSSKAAEASQAENERLKAELTSASQRLQIYQSAAKPSNHFSTNHNSEERRFF